MCLFHVFISCVYFMCFAFEAPEEEEKEEKDKFLMFFLLPH